MFTAFANWPAFVESMGSSPTCPRHIFTIIGLSAIRAGNGIALTIAPPGTLNEKVVMGEGFSSSIHPAGDLKLIKSVAFTGLLAAFVGVKGAAFFSFGTECIVTTPSVPDENSRTRAISIRLTINMPSRV